MNANITFSVGDPVANSFGFPSYRPSIFPSTTRKLRSNCVLASLNRDQMETLYDWIMVDGYAEALRKMAKPAPEGFGIKTHLMTLRLRLRNAG